MENIWVKLFNLIFEKVETNDLHLMYILVVELKNTYLFAKDHFKIH